MGRHQDDTSSSSVGRPSDTVKLGAFEKLCSYINESDECQYSSEEIFTLYKSLCDDEEVYTAKHLDQKLKEYFGDEIIITKLHGKPRIYSFRDRCHKILREDWERDTKASSAKDDIIDMAASIIRDEIRTKVYDTISYPLFASADTGIYPHAASQYHARPKAKRGIAMLSVDEFPYPRKQTRGNEFIPCSNNICDILKRFRSFKIPAITLIWPKSSYKHSVTRSYRSGRESGRRSESPLWRHQWRSFVFISHADDVKREIRLHISRLLTNQKRESARSMG